MTRKPLPYIPLDSLHPGDELRVKVSGCTPFVCTFSDFVSVDHAMWLELKTGFGLVHVLTSDIQRKNNEHMIQRFKAVVDADYWDTRVFDSIWQGDSKVVLR